VVTFTREDGDIMVLVDEVPAPHGGGWYCQLCDEHFDTQRDMDEHAEDMGHTHSDHGDSSSVHEGGWHCAICELNFNTEQDMDEHAEDMGHTHTDHGDHDGDYDPSFSDGHSPGSDGHQGGWHCAICELDFDTEEDMDQHAEEMGHTHTDHGDHDGDYDPSFSDGQSPTPTWSDGGS
jgi:hypothetical protein